MFSGDDPPLTLQFVLELQPLQRERVVVLSVLNTFLTIGRDELEIETSGMHAGTNFALEPFTITFEKSHHSPVVSA